MNWLEIARSAHRGEPVTAVTPFLEMPNMWVVPKNSPTKDIADLKGKDVGTYIRFAPKWLLFVRDGEREGWLRSEDGQHRAGRGAGSAARSARPEATGGLVHLLQPRASHDCDR